EANDLDRDLIPDPDSRGPWVLEDLDGSEGLAEVLSEHPPKALLERLSPELILVVDEAILPAASDDLRPVEVARKHDGADADRGCTASADSSFASRGEHEGLRAIRHRREHRATDGQAGEHEDRDRPRHFFSPFGSARPRSKMSGFRSSSSAKRRIATAARDTSSSARSTR